MSHYNTHAYTRKQGKKKHAQCQPPILVLPSAWYHFNQARPMPCPSKPSAKPKASLSSLDDWSNRWILPSASSEPYFPMLPSLLCHDAQVSRVCHRQRQWVRDKKSIIFGALKKKKKKRLKKAREKMGEKKQRAGKEGRKHVKVSFHRVTQSPIVSNMMCREANPSYLVIKM